MEVEQKCKQLEGEKNTDLVEGKGDYRVVKVSEKVQLKSKRHVQNDTSLSDTEEFHSHVSSSAFINWRNPLIRARMEKQL